MEYLLNIIRNYKHTLVSFKNDTNNENSINKYPVFVINLNTNSTRRNYIKTMMSKLKIDYSLIIVEKIPEINYSEIKKINKRILNINELGCCISHLWVLNYAIQNNFKKFIIFEDDIVFHKNFHALFNSVTSNLDYDMLMLGSHDFKIKSHISNYDWNRHIYKPIKNVLGGFSNMYTLEFARKLLNQKLNKLTSFDFDYNELYKDNNVNICYPNLVTTELSSTNLGHDFSFFNSLEENRYYLNCHPNFEFENYHFIYIELIETLMRNNELFDNITTYKELVEKIITNYTTDIKTKIMNRLDFDFFTIDDIKGIISDCQNDIYLANETNSVTMDCQNDIYLEEL